MHIGRTDMDINNNSLDSGGKAESAENWRERHGAKMNCNKIALKLP